MTVYTSSTGGATWDAHTQVTHVPSGYSSLSQLGLGNSDTRPDHASEVAVGLLFEQNDPGVCEQVLPQWKTAPDGAVRGLGSESCKIPFTIVVPPSPIHLVAHTLD